MIAILKKELFLSFSAYGTTILGLAFFITVIFVSTLGFDTDSNYFKMLGPGLTWATVLLSVIISSENIIKEDYHNGSLDLLLISPIPLEIILTLKGIAHWIGVCFPIIILTPVLSIMFGLSKTDLYWLIMGLLLGTPALSFIAVFGSCLTFSVKRASVLTPIIIMPLYIPTLVFGAKIINFSDIGNLYANTNLLVLGAITLISIAIVPFGASFGVRAGIR